MRARIIVVTTVLALALTTAGAAQANTTSLLGKGISSPRVASLSPAMASLPKWPAVKPLPAVTATVDTLGPYHCEHGYLCLYDGAGGAGYRLPLLCGHTFNLSTYHDGPNYLWSETVNSFWNNSTGDVELYTSDLFASTITAEVGPWSLGNVWKGYENLTAFARFEC